MYGLNLRAEDGSEFDADVTPRLHVHAEAIGTDAPPWTSTGDIVDVYCVTVDVYRKGETRSYQTRAYGSIHNHEQGTLDAEGLAWMVLDELHSAMVDPDEFTAMAYEGAGITPDRMRAILAVIDFAADAKSELTEAEALIREHN